MTRKKDDALEDVLDERQFADSVERLAMKISNAYHNKPSPDLAIVVDVETTNKKARKDGWPSAKMMQEGVKRALELLPPRIAKRVKLKYKTLL